MKKLVSGFILGSVLLLGSAAPALATEGHTPVSFCHNGHFITTDDDGATNGHKTGKGIHANDVFAEDLGRPVNPSDCKGPVDVPRNPGPKHTVDYSTAIDCVANTKILTAVATVTEYVLDAEENVWNALPPIVTSSQSVDVPTAEECPPVIPPHGEPSPPVTEPVTPEPVTPEPADETYPAPPVTPNTVNGTPVAPVEPAAPAGVEAAAEAPTTAASANEPAQLAYTGANDGLILWGAVGFAALIAGIVSVVRVRRNA